MKGKANNYDEMLGNNLRCIRLMLDMSQVDLARVADVSFQQIQKYEAGKNRISVSKLLIISQNLNVDLDMFLSGLLDDQAEKITFSDIPEDNLKLVMKLLLIKDTKKIKSILQLLQP